MLQVRHGPVRNVLLQALILRPRELKLLLQLLVLFLELLDPCQQLGVISLERASVRALLARRVLLPETGSVACQDGARGLLGVFSLSDRLFSSALQQLLPPLSPLRVKSLPALSLVAAKIFGEPVPVVARSRIFFQLRKLTY